MAIEFIEMTIKDVSWLVLEFSLDSHNDFIADKFKRNVSYHFRSVFYLSESDLLMPNSKIHEEPVEGESSLYIFPFAQLREDGYYIVSKPILGTNNTVFIHKDIPFKGNLFVAARDISIFRKIDEICKEDIFVGGTHESAIPWESFQLLMKLFPTTYELNRYAQARISNILQDHLGTMIDAELNLHKFQQKKDKKLSLLYKGKEEIYQGLYEQEIEKYEGIRGVLNKRLEKGDTIIELEWQKFLKEILLLIFPQYIAALKEVKIPDHFSSDRGTVRGVDFVLVNADGYIDILEIKRPFENCILSKREYRDNFCPKKELSGAVMQVEKYLLCINESAIKLGKELTQKHKEELPEDVEIKIRNPRGKIILGRSKGLAKKQIEDFEVIKRQYSNIIDIMSYDDILLYLDNIIAAFKKKKY